MDMQTFIKKILEEIKEVSGARAGKLLQPSGSFTVTIRDVDLIRHDVTSTVMDYDLKDLAQAIDKSGYPASYDLKARTVVVTVPAGNWMSCGDFAISGAVA